MLVYYKEPYGILYLDRFRIYGKWTNRLPTDIPYKLWKNNQSVLYDAPYDMNGMIFRFCELKFWDQKALMSLAAKMGVTKHKGYCKSYTYLIGLIRTYLKKISPKDVT